MKPAYSRPTNSVDERDRLFASFMECGYRGLQLKASQYVQFVDSPDRFSPNNGKRPSLASGLIAAGSLDVRSVQALRAVIAFAAKVQSERIIFCHTAPRDGLTPELLHSYARTLERLGSESDHVGVQLSLHHHYGQPVMKRDEIERFFGWVRSPSVKLTIDTAHLVKSGITDVAGVIHQFEDVIDNIHLKDYAAGEWRSLGDGEVDFPSIFDALKDINYQGWICVDEESGTDLERSLRQSYSFIEPWL